MALSESTEKPTYTLRFPFQLASGQELSGLDQPIEHKVGDLTVRFNRQGTYYFLVVQGFDAEESAKAYLNSLWTGLMWVLLNRGLAFNAVLEFDKVTYANPLKAAENLSKTFGLAVEGPLDGLVNGNLPAVYPSNKHIGAMTAGTISITTSISSEQFLSLLIEGTLIPNSLIARSNSKLRIALELYSAYFSERSSNARLLTLVMALETLTSSQPKHKVAQELLNQWQLQVGERKQQLPVDSDEYEALESLERELLFRREASLRSQIRTLVQDTLEAEGNPNTYQLARRAVKVYDSRSTLVHEGVLPTDELRTAEQDAREIVVMVLKSKLRTVDENEPTGT
jgi:hypothetical protein